MTVDAQELSRAIVVWSGWGETSWPARDEARVLDEFGHERAAELIPRIREAKDEFYASDARFLVADLANMAEQAKADFRRGRSDLSDEAVAALAWCYTYDYK